MGTRCADHVTPLYPQKLALTWPTGGGRSVGIVRVRTKATEFSFSFIITSLPRYEFTHVQYLCDTAQSWLCINMDFRVCRTFYGVGYIICFMEYFRGGMFGR